MVGRHPVAHEAKRDRLLLENVHAHLWVALEQKVRGIEAGGAAPDDGDVRQYRMADKKWFFLTADYAFGHSLENDTAAVVKANGGTVVGSVRHPLSASDFSSFLLQAQASKADMISSSQRFGVS